MNFNLAEIADRKSETADPVEFVTFQNGPRGNKSVFENQQSFI